jgi:tRNA threonylcarbamoyladenosine biosynthesis protein TsaE
MTENLKKTLHSLEETKAFAQEFVEGLTPWTHAATVVGLYGNLGAGKTSFTQGVAAALGISDTINSPTFVIEKIYAIPEKENTQTFSHLIHIDAYRLEKAEEMLRLGWAEIISNPLNLILVEWPERIAGIMPEHIQVKFEHVTEDERTAEINYI